MGTAAGYRSELATTSHMARKHREHKGFEQENMVLMEPCRGNNQTTGRRRHRWRLRVLSGFIGKLLARVPIYE
jgi:hypothetical protein